MLAQHKFLSGQVFFSADDGRNGHASMMKLQSISQQIRSHRIRLAEPAGISATLGSGVEHPVPVENQCPDMAQFRGQLIGGNDELSAQSDEVTGDRFDGITRLFGLMAIQ